MSQSVMVITVFTPLEGKTDELLALTAEHVPILRRLGLATDRPALAMRASDGSVLEVFEWASPEAIQQAHTNPEVLAMWKRYEACCTYRTLADLSETKEMFPSFSPLPTN